MNQEVLAKQFARWYRMSHDNKKTVCLLGMRADESLQRYSGFVNKKYGYNGECWITKQFKDIYMPHLLCMTGRYQTFGTRYMR